MSWMSKLQKIVALSTTDAEYVAATKACKELIWLKDYMKEIGKEQVSLPLHTNSQSVIDIVKNQVYHDKTKHIDYGTTSFAHFLRIRTRWDDVAILIISFQVRDY